MPFTGRAGGVAIPWTPANLASPSVIWINDDSAVTDTGGGVISQWNDISGNAYHFTQASSDQNPLIVAAAQNGRRVTRFSGGGKALINANGGALGVFRNHSQGWMAAVYKKIALYSPSTTGHNLFSVSIGGAGTTSRFTYSNNFAAGVDKAQLVVRRLDADSAALLPLTSTVNTSYHIHMATMDWGQGDGTVYYDGTQEAQNLALTSSGNTSDTATVNFILGSGATDLNSDIAELIIGRTIPGSTEREKLEGYLAHRWGLTANLPALHPYKTNPPTV